MRTIPARFRPLITALVLVCSCVSLAAAFGLAPPKKDLAFAVEYFQIDSARVIAKWSRPCDNKGCADSYEVKWVAGASAAMRRTTALVDTFRVERPVFGDSLLATVAITSYRRNVAGSSRTATTYIRNPDAPPPPVDSLKVDTTTVPQADSSRLLVYSSAGVLLSGEIRVTEFDSILFFQRKWFPPGTVRRDRTIWPVEGAAAVRMNVVGRGDSAWMVVLACNCLSTPGNPPQLDLRNGQFVVRDGAGGWTPALPITAANPR